MDIFFPAIFCCVERYIICKVWWKKWTLCLCYFLSRFKNLTISVGSTENLSKIHKEWTNEFYFLWSISGISFLNQIFQHLYELNRKIDTYTFQCVRVLTPHLISPNERVWDREWTYCVSANAMLECSEQ